MIIHAWPDSHNRSPTSALHLQLLPDHWKRLYSHVLYTAEMLQNNLQIDGASAAKL